MPTLVAWHAATGKTEIGSGVIDALFTPRVD
jgi:hypothetical protein